MERMRRTQIYLEPELSEALDQLARQRGISRAGLIRLAARRFVERETMAEGQTLLDLIGIGNAGPGRASEEHDCLLTEHSLEGRVL